MFLDLVPVYSLDQITRHIAVSHTRTSFCRRSAASAAALRISPRPAVPPPPPTPPTRPEVGEAALEFAPPSRPPDGVDEEDRTVCPPEWLLFFEHMAPMESEKRRDGSVGPRSD